MGNLSYVAYSGVDIILLLLLLFNFDFVTLHISCKLKGAGHCKSAKRMTSILRHVAEALPPARQGTILNNH